MTEAKLQAKIIKKFKSAHAFCEKMESRSAVGFPDLLAMKDCRVLLIEVKHPNGRGVLEDLQVEKIAEIRALGLVVVVVDSLEDALAAGERYLKITFK